MKRLQLILPIFILASKLAASQTPCILKANGVMRYYDCTYSNTYNPKNIPVNIPFTAYKEVSITFTSSYIHTLNSDIIKLPNTAPTTNLIFLTITRSKLTSIGDNALKSFPKLQIMNISNNNIARLDRLDFNGPVNLTMLNISRNNISIIDDMAFGEQIALHTLDLSHNALPSINNTHFKSTHFLKSLDLSYNSIKTIELQAFSGLVNLITLNLNSNKIVRLDNRFAHLSMLQELYLSGNGGLMITSDMLMGLKWLEVLDLSGNGIENIYWEPFRYATSLKFLDLSDNRITDFNIRDITISTLKNISIRKNVFVCDELVGLIKKFKGVEVAVMEGPDVDMVNVFGIGCNSSNVVLEENAEFSVDNSTNVAEKADYSGWDTIILALQVVILVLIVAQIVMGKCFRRRHMDSRNLKELEGIF